MYTFKHWWIFKLRICRVDHLWDGGGMDCGEPWGVKLGVDVGNLVLEFRWKYTRGQLLRLAKRDPELWHNCKLPGDVK